MLVRVLPKVVVGTGSQYMIIRITVGIGSLYLSRIVKSRAVLVGVLPQGPLQ